MAMATVSPQAYCPYPSAGLQPPPTQAALTHIARLTHTACHVGARRQPADSLQIAHRQPAMSRLVAVPARAVRAALAVLQLLQHAE